MNVKVKVPAPPVTVNVCGLLVEIVGVAGFALIVTSALLLAEQPAAFVTVRLSVTLPEAPAVYVIVWMFVALVIVPLAIDQA